MKPGGGITTATLLGFLRISQNIKIGEAMGPSVGYQPLSRSRCAGYRNSRVAAIRVLLQQPRVGQD